ncbi:MAG: hypothetical protein ACXWV4_00080 [Flavitalea sp.]
MKFFLSTILIALVSLVLGMFLPWWTVAIAAFGIVYLYRLRPGLAFLSGFAGVFICWALVALFRENANDGILSHKIALIFPLGGSGALLILVSALIGGLVGGMAGLTASLIHRVKSEE